MAASSVTFESLRNQINNRKFSSVYLLHGEEGYFTDKIVQDFEGILSPEEKEFDFHILYAPQVTMPQVMDVCYRFPFVAEKQVVILKEAQAISADQINKLHAYVKNPSPSTILVISFRGAEAKGKDLVAAARAKATVFESKKVKDYQLEPLISSYLKQKGLGIDQKSQEMLRDFIGSDLSRLFNELDKLALILGKGATVTPESIERNIGFSKDFNNFELIDALAVRDAGKAMRIAEYFASNPKNNPLVMTTALLYNFFSDLLVIIYTKDKSEDSLCKALKLKSPYALKRYRPAMRNYNAFQLIEIIWALRQFDCQSKGIDSRQNAYSLFHDLIFHILSAPGVLIKNQKNR